MIYSDTYSSPFRVTVVTESSLCWSWQTGWFSRTLLRPRRSARQWAICWAPPTSLNSGPPLANIAFVPPHCFMYQTKNSKDTWYHSLETIVETKTLRYSRETAVDVFWSTNCFTVIWSHSSAKEWLHSASTRTSCPYLSRSRKTWFKSSHASKPRLGIPEKRRRFLRIAS